MESTSGMPRGRRYAFRDLRAGNPAHVSAAIWMTNGRDYWSWTPICQRGHNGNEHSADKVETAHQVANDQLKATHDARRNDMIGMALC
jgi:hypothetical protein